MRMENAADSAHPLMAELEPGTYYWCMCGRTKTPPFCDGSHIGSEFTPLEFGIEERTEVALCNCGLTHTPPYCDGSHVDY